jgi:hypothetical protein
MNDSCGHPGQAPNQSLDSPRHPKHGSSAQSPNDSAAELANQSPKRSTIKHWFDIGFSSLGFGKKQETFPDEEFAKLMYAAAQEPGAGDPTRDLASLRTRESLSEESGPRGPESPSQPAEPSSPSAQKSWFMFPWSEKPVTAGAQQSRSSVRINARCTVAALIIEPPGLFSVGKSPENCRDFFDSPPPTILDPSSSVFSNATLCQLGAGLFSKEVSNQAEHIDVEVRVARGHA